MMLRLACLLFLLLASVSVMAPTPSSAAYQFTPSGLDGAGFQNVIAIKPGDPNFVLSGSDVAGVQKSTDGGATWTAFNEGLETLPNLKVASIVFQNSSTIFITIGNGTSGGIYKSVSGGPWTPFNTSIYFSGGNTSVAALPNPHPRSTGNLVAFESTGTYMYVGTFSQGVYRCTLSSGVCDNIGMVGLYIRSLAIDPLDHTILFAAAHHNSDPTKTGVFKGTGVSTGTGEHFSRLTSPATANTAYYIEELKFIGNNMLYAVGKDNNGDGKVYKVTGSGATWAVQKTQAGSNFISVDGYYDSATSKFVILVGTSSQAYNDESVYRSIDSGATWSLATPHFGTGDMVGGGTWWMAANEPNAMMNEGTYVGAHILFSNTTDKTVYIAGRAGVWKSVNQGADWYPAVRNMNVTFNRAIAVDEAGASKSIYIIDTDWQFLYSTDEMQHVESNDSGIPSARSGMAVAVNKTASPHITYIGVGNRNSNINGGIYSSTTPQSGTWSDEGLSGATGYNNERILGLAAKTISSTPVLLAAVEGKGIYRKSGSTWTYVLSTVLSTVSTKTVPIVWDQSRSVAYFYDRDSGIYRSGDDGLTWSLVHSAVTAKLNGNETGYLALDEANNRLYFTNSSGLYVQTSASSATFSPSSITAIAIDPVAYTNMLYAAGQATNVAPLPTANMYTYTYGGSLTPIGDGFYTDNGGFPLSIDVDSDDIIYVGMAGVGVFIGTP